MSLRTQGSVVVISGGLLRIHGTALYRRSVVPSDQSVSTRRTRGIDLPGPPQRAGAPAPPASPSPAGAPAAPRRPPAVALRRRINASQRSDARNLPNLKPRNLPPCE
eukprot:7426123-Pyramimonas_sp.AAC.1